VIQWANFKLLISELAKNETIYITDEYASRNKYDKRTWKTETKADREMALLNIPMIHRVEEKYICPDVTHWEQRYYKALFGTDNSLDKICVNYLEGLEWTFKYYIGDCPDWRWSYEYHYPPLFVDLINYIPTTEKSILKHSRKPFTPNVQLAYVLPPAQFDLLPEKTRAYLQTNFSEYYSDTIEFQWAFCRYFWEAHVKFKNVDVEDWEKHIS
jgi:5'-3' exonuclease